MQCLRATPELDLPTCPSYPPALVILLCIQMMRCRLLAPGTPWVSALPLPSLKSAQLIRVPISISGCKAQVQHLHCVWITLLSSNPPSSSSAFPRSWSASWVPSPSACFSGSLDENTLGILQKLAMGPATAAHEPGASSPHHLPRLDFWVSPSAQVLPPPNLSRFPSPHCKSLENLCPPILPSLHWLH